MATASELVGLLVSQGFRDNLGIAVAETARKINIVPREDTLEPPFDQSAMAQGKREAWAKDAARGARSDFWVSAMSPMIIAEEKGELIAVLEGFVLSDWQTRLDVWVDFWSEWWDSQ